MPYKIPICALLSRPPSSPLLQARTRGGNADFCNFSSRHVLQRPAVAPNARSVPPPWHAIAFPRLVNSGLVLPRDPSHLPVTLTLGKPPQSRARHFRGKIRPPVSTMTYRQVRTAPFVSRFPRWRMRALSFSLDPLLKSVSRFHSFSALLVCSDYHLLRP